MSNLKNRREAAGLSQTKLAEISGVSVRSIRAYEAEAQSARKNINVAEAITVVKLARALGCDVGDLLEPEV